MGNVKILDCTLRDGGYINSWKFGRDNIKEIISNLVAANIDIIEVGFLRPMENDVDTSIFTRIEEISEVIYPKKEGVHYAVMIENRNYQKLSLPNYDGSSADIIRLTFRKNEWGEAKDNICDIIAKGYKVCVQPVGTTGYDDKSLLRLIEEVNELKPFAFYMVDTLGIMYRYDISKFFYLIDNNLSGDICLGYHSHNNLQMAFANAQEMTRLNNKRTIILDASCYGMGRGVGNLATELIIDYINNNIEQRYSIDPILNIVDRCLMPIYAEQRWGYDMPYFLSAIVKCHPNYASYLMKKETLSIEKIEKVLSLIPIEERGEYNSQLIEKLYAEIQSYDVDDQSAYSELKKLVGDREVVILGLGMSTIRYREKIRKIAQGRLLISINFIPTNYDIDMLFISNEKRLNSVNLVCSRRVIATSNLKEYIQSALFFNYSSLLGEGDASDNAGAMLIKILTRAGTRKIFLAGFDGFDVDVSVNYAISTYKKALDYNTAKKKNEDISKQLRLALKEVDYEIITPTRYEISNI